MRRSPVIHRLGRGAIQGLIVHRSLRCLLTDGSLLRGLLATGGR